MAVSDKNTATIRDCDPARDWSGLRSCILAMQDFERCLELALRAGADMADAYVDLLLRRCDGETGCVLVAEADKTVVGFVAVLAEEVPKGPDEEATPYTYISDLVVLPSYRRRGIGNALLQHAEVYARKTCTTVLRINVLSKNEIAGRLYRAFGFTDYRIELLKRLC
jgi:ribosomal protein S18 acetylase RimI-like enzyme